MKNQMERQMQPSFTKGLKESVCGEGVEVSQNNLFEKTKKYTENPLIIPISYIPKVCRDPTFLKLPYVTLRRSAPWWNDRLFPECLERQEPIIVLKV